MAKARVVLLTGSSLCHNPRALKAASALARAGCDVQVLGAWLDPDLKAQDQKVIAGAPFRFTPVLDVTRPGWRAASAQLPRRVRRKAANVLHAMTRLESAHQLGFTIRPLMAHAQEMTPDLFIAHSEQAMYVAWQLMRQGRRVGVDMEDWFSEDLLPQARRSRPLKLLRFLEGELLRRGTYASCPSRAMRDALAAAYGCQFPAVIYNAFGWAERAAIDGLRRDRRDPNAISLCWYSQTLGPGRGLEDLAGALALLDGGVEVHLRGRAAPGMQEWVRGRLPETWQRRVFFHPLVPHDEVLSRVAEHDIGFAGEMKCCRSRDLTVTNKILHYLLGGLAVIASDTAGQREIAVQAHGAVKLYEPGNPQALADALASLIAASERLRGAKAAALRAAEQIFCWERQESTLIERVLAAVGAQRRGLQAAGGMRESMGSRVV